MTVKPLPIMTTAPMPTLGSLLSWGSIPTEGRMSLPWVSPGDHFALFARARWALRAVVDGFTQADGVAPRVWVPDYFCNSALVSVRQTAATLVFYPTTAGFEPDWPACEAMARSIPPRLFLQVHYFGWPSDMTRARAFCHTYQAVLIEDAAHALAPTATIGQRGDYTIWSFYKHLPAPDGALLTARASAAAAAAVVRAARKLCGRGEDRPHGWWMRRLMQRLAPAAVARLRPGQPPFEFDPQALELPSSPGMSRLARRMIAGYSGHLPAIAERRLVNEAAVRRSLQSCPGLRPAFPPPSLDGAPYRAVFRAETTETARYWYDRLTQAGHAVETWPDLAPEIHAAPGRHAVALSLRATCIGLPIHADRTPEELSTGYGRACT